jgi:DNA-directed RNA polymerase subunit RPC12/RpoP
MRAPLKYSLSPIYAQKQRHGVELLADPGMMVRGGEASVEGKAALSMRPSAEVYKLCCHTCNRTVVFPAGETTKPEVHACPHCGTKLWI